jgi:hypothetical protein
MSLFDAYWRTFGLPFSRFRGMLTDAVPFSLVETSLWEGGLATGIWVVCLVQRKDAWAKPWVRRISFLLGPLFLIALSLGQGVFPFSLAPTAWRPSLTQDFGTDSLSQDDFKAWAAQRESQLRQDFDWSAYQSLTEQEVLNACSASLDTVLEDLGLPPGRTVRTIKPMGPLTTAMGLIYGGPAFHDPFYGEIGMVQQKDAPYPHHWRLIAACHESAHAKGFTREMDAEILTQLALSRIPDPRYQVLADLHFLQKTGLKVQWPDSLISEASRMRQERRDVQKHQRAISFLRRWVNRLHLENSGKKYGDREHNEVWNPRQPFFATVHRLQVRVTTKP